MNSLYVVQIHAIKSNPLIELFTFLLLLNSLKWLFTAPMLDACWVGGWIENKFPFIDFSISIFESLPLHKRNRNGIESISLYMPIVPAYVSAMKANFLVAFSTFSSSSTNETMKDEILMKKLFSFLLITFSLWIQLRKPFLSLSLSLSLGLLITRSLLSCWKKAQNDLKGMLSRRFRGASKEEASEMCKEFIVIVTEWQ